MSINIGEVFEIELVLSRYLYIKIVNWDKMFEWGQAQLFTKAELKALQNKRV